MALSNDAHLRVAGSKTGTVPAWGLSQAFAVQTASVPRAANIWDSPEFTTIVAQTSAIPNTLWFSSVSPVCEVSKSSSTEIPYCR